MSSTPLMASSRGEATVSAMTFGLAPGNWALTMTDVGMISGYSAKGSLKIEIRPASRMTTDRTPAKMGRSMKNFEIFMIRLGRREARIERLYGQHWRRTRRQPHAAELSHWL